MENHTYVRNVVLINVPMRKCRTKDIDFNILKELNEKDKGRVIEDIVAEVLCLKNLNVVSSPSDLTIHKKYGESQVKARSLDTENNRWKFNLNLEIDALPFRYWDILFMIDLRLIPSRIMKFCKKG